ncbi:helix-turn-helix transcriptional regulator [Sphingobacterium thalpophilum]|uniref:helix-turn-helix transcriptional regulator n=1 Tax=Sphingobacterium thalpophilum TaxID=259 RepID=UPI0024A6E455|nr:AraC family transcriptional regulator [Sphingobacterium thalpophilum]
MKQLSAGTYYGEINRKFKSNELLVSDANYTLEKVDWHYHQNPYFTFIVRGSLIEGNKKGRHLCHAGDLLFHNWQDAHYNIKPEGLTRGFHIELSPGWEWMVEANLGKVEGNINIECPQTKLVFHQLYWESFNQDNSSALTIDSLLLNAFSRLAQDRVISERHVPKWAYMLRDYLRTNFKELLSLAEIAKLLDLHPVYLSKEFSRYFGTTMGGYVRKLKVQHALTLLPQHNLSLTEVAYLSGFADQSHFIRCFREFIGVVPSLYRKTLFS